MEFRIADTFYKALTKLSNKEMKAAKTTVFDLQADRSGNGLRLHKVDRVKDKRFLSVSVNKDIRIIVHKDGESLLLCYVDHHEDAYQWAQNRRLEVHPTTGAAQIVEVVETVEEVTVTIPIYKEEPAKPNKPRFKERPLRNHTDEFLMKYGVPEVWLKKLKAADEDELLALAERLPSEAGEAVLDLAVGVIPEVPTPIAKDANPFEHPDALRRFRTIDSKEELEAALDYPWDKWTVFLHPSQRAMVSKDFSGPARVSGAAGTGKTVVALHRAVHLAKSDEDARILLTTFSDALANALQDKCNRLLRPEPRIAEQIDVYSLDSVGQRIYKARGGRNKLVNPQTIRSYIIQHAQSLEQDFTDYFLFKEWEEVVDPLQLTTWEAYRDVTRIGRRTRLPVSKREELWKVFAAVFQQLAAQNEITKAGQFHYLADQFSDPDSPAPYEYIIVDEAQDIDPPQLRFLGAMAQNRPNSLFFAGDLGQRIFQAPFSWEQLGVKVRGRSRTLRINYRTSHQIRQQADKLLSTIIEDVDGNKEERKNMQSVFNGPAPELLRNETEAEEQEQVAAWIKARLSEGLEPEEIALFVRSESELDRAKTAIAQAGQQACELDERLRTQAGQITLSTMHLAKGLEFRAVAVLAIDEEVIPDGSRIEAATDPMSIEEIYETERHLLYVACTRARDYLLMSCVGEGSEFLEDLGV
jgi:hypothetical protein